MDVNNLNLGFSTGVLHKSHTAKEALEIIKDIGCNALELGFVKLNRIEEGWLDKISKEDIAPFRYVSFHAPKFNYGNNRKTEEIFQKIEKIDAIRKLDLVVFHPDCIEDFDVFKSATFNIAFENMDDRKESCKRPEDLEHILSRDNRYKMVLDVNHIYSNDPSMGLAKEFYTKLGPKIAQIHLSGHAGCHDPIFKTKQTEIIKSIQNFDIPIIIESTVSSEEISKERDYILKIITSLS